MKFLIVVAAFLLSACGLDPISVAKRTLGNDDDRRSESTSSCSQPYGFYSYLENHSGHALSLTLSYYDWYSAGGETSYVNVSIPAGQAWGGLIKTVNVTRDGYSCSSIPEKVSVDLKGEGSNFKLCRIKNGVAYLVDGASTCPPYSSSN